MIQMKHRANSNNNWFLDLFRNKDKSEKSQSPKPTSQVPSTSTYEYYSKCHYWQIKDHCLYWRFNKTSSRFFQWLLHSFSLQIFNIGRFNRCLFNIESSM